jgi:hypothetical protein
MRCFDATHPAHLPLPRAIGEYAVARVTQVYSDFHQVQVFGTYRTSSALAVGTSNPWTSVFVVRSKGFDTAINSPAGDPAGNAHSQVFEMLADPGYTGATVVPSAFTVQVMNPNPLQTTAGIVYIGRLKTQPTLENSSRKWSTLADEFVSLQAPRLCSAGKLALRGVHVNAMPLNMTALSDFTTILPSVAGDFVWNGQSSNQSLIHNTGFSPIMVYNPQSVGLQFLVTMELRVRFDLGNPAASAHRQHTAAPDSVWNRALSAMSQAGHGAMDIVETVAQYGQAASTIANTARAVGNLISL